MRRLLRCKAFDALLSPLFRSCSTKHSSAAVWRERRREVTERVRQHHGILKNLADSGGGERGGVCVCVGGCVEPSLGSLPIPNLVEGRKKAEITSVERINEKSGRGTGSVGGDIHLPHT